MEPPFIECDYLELPQGAKLAKRAILENLNNISLGPKCVVADGATIDARFTKIELKRYVVVQRDALIKPSYRDLKIGEHVFIGEHSTVEALSVGSFVYVGPRCSIGKGAILNPYCHIEADTVVPPKMVVPSFAVVSGQPGQVVRLKPESASQRMRELTSIFHEKFVKKAPF